MLKPSGKGNLQEFQIKQFSAEEIDIGIEKLKRRIEQVKALEEDKVKWNDQRKKNTESDIRETLLDVFGEASPQFKKFGHHRIGSTNMMEQESIRQEKFKQGILNTITMLEGLISNLQEKKLDIDIATSLKAPKDDILNSLREQLTEEQRKIINTIWKYYLEKENWIPQKVLHATFSKDNAIRAISNLGGNIIFVDSNYQKYQLTIIGIFLSEHGVMYERLIHDYLKYIRKRFYEDPELEQIKCEEIESAFNLDKDQSRLLNRLILLGHFWGGSAGGGDNWTVGLPTDIDEIPEDINEYLQGYIKRRYDLSYGKSKVPTQNTLLRDVNMDIAVAVFVIHGRNKKLRDSMFSFLRSIGLQPIEWSQAVKLTGKASPFIGEVLDAAFNNAQAVVALLSPDDEARLLPLYQNPNDEGYEKNLTPQPRPNVLFETGMAFGNNPDRTVIVQIGRLRPFSDIQGRHVLRFDGSSEMRLELCNRLETAGCVVNRSGSDWLSVGDFDIEQINNVNISEDVKSENLSNDLLLKKISLSEKYKIEWSLERESTIADVKIGKRIMAKVNNNLLELVTSYQNEISEDIRTKIQKILSDIKAIEKIRIYADGGLSYRTFWESGDLVFKKLASIEWI